MINCDICGKEIIPENKDGLLGGARLVFEDGTQFDVCTECINRGCTELEYLENFLERWKEENGN